MAMTWDCFELDFDASAFRLRTVFCADLTSVAAGLDWAVTLKSLASSG
jgi:hypothetical protein